jgi:hypothetical protein
MNAPSELQIQVGLRKRLRHIAPAICLVAIPNGAKRGPRAINQAMKEGLRLGFPDIMALPNDNSGRVAFIEVKAPKGKVDPNQNDWHERLRRWGYPCIVIRSVDEGEAFLRGLNYPFMVEEGVLDAA